MNLHVVPDNTFINKFYENLQELGLVHNNRIVVRTQAKQLKYIKYDLPFGRLYSRGFDNATGHTGSYDKVFIHQFTPLLYRWVAASAFNELNWMVWGADLYNLPSVHSPLFEKNTLNRYIKWNFSLNDVLYRAKISLLHEPWRSKAYSKVDHVLTWMTSEYDFAVGHLPLVKPAHKFFFYENDLPYHALDEVMTARSVGQENEKPLYILGNSATPELNHLDAVACMEARGVVADLCVPVSYGSRKYAAFLKRNLSFSGGEVRFIDRFMPFKDYLQFLCEADGLIMNNIRPQGYGNIFMMMYLGKQIFLNSKNPSTHDLDENGLRWKSIREVKDPDSVDWKENRSAVTALLSHEALLQSYSQLFS